MCANNKAREIAWAAKKRYTGKNAPKPKTGDVCAAIKKSRFAGNAGVDSPSAKSAWKKMSGVCPATVLPGNALIVEDKTVSGISKREKKKS
jgi:hypothetical protein